MVAYDRVIGISAHKVIYDLDWNLHPEYTREKYQNMRRLPKPESLQYMIDASKVLSEPFPHVRVDFYEVDGKLYFGELTFTPDGGYVPYLTDHYLLELGQQLQLPAKGK